MTLGTMLARAGIETVIIDKEDIAASLEQKTDGRASAIAYGSFSILEKAGIWSFLAEDASPIKQIRVSDQDSSHYLHYDNRLVGKKDLGYMVENHSIKQGLYQAVQTQPQLKFIAPAAYQNIHRDTHGVTVTLEDGRVFQAALLIAADGRSSRIRRDAHIPATTKPYGQTGIVCNVTHEKHHQFTAQERFLSPGPFAILPLKGGHHSSLVWTEAEHIAPLLLKMSESRLNEEMRLRFGDYLGQVKISSPVFSYPLTLHHAKYYSATRLALVGDAAHGIHPLAGQGYNLGIRSAEVLAKEIISQHALGLDIGSDAMLKRYEQACYFDSNSLIGITGGLNHLFTSDITPVKLVRRLGLSVVNSLRPVKKMLMRHAMGMHSAR